MVTIDAVLTGAVLPFGPAGEPSAIVKQPVADPCAVGPLGLSGDAQADLTVHGGADKAIHHYPFDHYAAWAKQLPDSPALAEPGAFGENISTTGLVETEVCIGDRWRLGSALVEIAQGRQPCWKQGHRLGDTRVLAAMIKHRRCGWYYRVIEPGTVEASSRLTLVDRPYPSWSVARVIGLLIGGDACTEPAAVADLARLSVLADGWRLRAARLAGT